MDVYHKTRFNVAVECFSVCKDVFFTDSAAALNLIKLRIQISKLGYGIEKGFAPFLFTKFCKLLHVHWSSDRDETIIC